MSMDNKREGVCVSVPLLVRCCHQCFFGLVGGAFHPSPTPPASRLCATAVRHAVRSNGVATRALRCADRGLAAVPLKIIG